MADRDEIAEGLKKVWDAFDAMEHELYADYVFEALELLTPVEPEKLTVLDFGSMESELCLCGACHKPIGNGDKFCKHCGREVRWECNTD